MIINEKLESIIPIEDIHNYYIVTDFDRTITTGNSKTSWSILASSDFVPKEYITDRNKLYDYYRPIELNETMDSQKRQELVSEWFRKHIELFIKYGITEELFETAVTDLNVMELRKGAKEFLEMLHINNIPLIIISAGIGNFIEIFLRKNNCYFDNIHISSNRIIFKDNVAIGVEGNIIHSLNKNEVSLPPHINAKLKGKQKVILIGDQISDLKMVDKSRHEKVVTIGFYEKNTDVPLSLFEENFDIVCKEEDDFFTLRKKIFK